jgi:hypothetical protein
MMYLAFETTHVSAGTTGANHGHEPCLQTQLLLNIFILGQ